MATPGALDACEAANVSPSSLLTRHASGDWGEICAFDRQQNEIALREGFRLLSSYPLDGVGKLWIITEADRSSTCLLLPREY